MKFQGFAVVVVVAAVVAGCGDVCMTGAFGPRAMRATGTVAAWLDSTVFEDQGDGSVKRTPRDTDATVLHLEFFEPRFDPTVDFGALPAGERTALLDDISRGDQLSVRVQRGEALRPGDAIASLPDEGLPPEVLPFIGLTAVQMRDRVDGDAGYPDAVARLGSRVTSRLAVEQTTPTLVGTLTVTVKAADGEDAALEGEVVVDFDAELLAERVAECNFDRFGQGPIDVCTLAPASASAGLPGR